MIDFEAKARDLLWGAVARGEGHADFVRALRQLAADVLEEAAKEVEDVTGASWMRREMATKLRARATAIKDGKQ
jgi:hypothetical protein